MKTIYTAAGEVNKGFIGQIAYTVCLDKTYTELDVHLQFDKQRIKTPSPECESEIQMLMREKYGEQIDKVEAAEIAKSMKTEIQLIVQMNDTFIGGIHRQMKDRHLYISPSYATEGAIPQTAIEGVIRIVVIFFNVLCDNTGYTVSLSAG
ncbi:hypothetical protein DWQ65_01190 [Treponema phagedenis]|uniref:Uncharacterized protein n=1 Tax=Treponema phagedenis TaxID=162 RepID=A0A0B7GWD7_TREPH|nr:DUF6669 family protein [Treponema phagedenis]NVP24998.1 hypothetical protein [Treponema phagedenis]QEJ94087.1 hypothetical protein FUT79_01875 [Treponema phagedenis]QEJ97113.1 hypothetical protein FUT82_03350 [Treponema phagedenis]QEK01903.1 hypothetical protein FUT84_12535 [Treponema phagedenis]QEK02697.1 hypothetical protein FUT83_01985 [Treponema phagedenis]